MANEYSAGWLAAEVLGANFSIDVMVDLDPISRRHSIISDGLGYLTALTALADSRLKLRCGIHFPKDEKAREQVRAEAFEKELTSRDWQVRSMITPPSLDLFIIDNERCYAAYNDGNAFIFTKDEHPNSVKMLIGLFATTWDACTSGSDTKILLFEDLIELEIPHKGSAIALLSSETWDDIISRLSVNPEELHNFDPTRFEELIAELLTRDGFNVQITGRTRDGGRDILAVHRDLLGEHLYLVECKRWSPNQAIGVEIIRALYGVVEHERASAGILVTTSRFTSGALCFATPIKYRMSLKEYEDVVNWIRKGAFVGTV